jgi:hypothetical protein
MFRPDACMQRFGTWDREYHESHAALAAFRRQPAAGVQATLSDNAETALSAATSEFLRA